MSKPRYDWWPYVKGMIRRYPALKAEHDALHNTSMTANYSGMPGGGEAGRNTEVIAIRELPGTRQREYAAVTYAIRTTERLKSGQDRMRLVTMMFWDRQYTLEGAAMRIPCSIAVAKRWHGEFIRLTASYYGLMDDDSKNDTPEPKK